MVWNWILFELTLNLNFIEIGFVLKLKLIPAGIGIEVEIELQLPHYLRHPVPAKRNLTMIVEASKGTIFIIASALNSGE